MDGLAGGVLDELRHVADAVAGARATELEGDPVEARVVGAAHGDQHRARRCLVVRLGGGGG
jgi:hypothetical protein